MIVAGSRVRINFWLTERAETGLVVPNVIPLLQKVCLYLQHQLDLICKKKEKDCSYDDSENNQEEEQQGSQNFNQHQPLALQ